MSVLNTTQVHAPGIRPAPFRNNHLIYTQVMLQAEYPGPAYWHFKSLLEDVNFVATFQEFWQACHGQQ